MGGAEIATSAALFDEAEYRGDIKGDLFGDERFFCDAEQFWQLQNAAIAKLRDDMTAKGWQAVHVIGPAERFQAWGHKPVPKAKGGAAFIEVEPNGRVTVHKGLLPSADARKALRATDDETGDESADEAARPERPELSAPLANYIDLVRHSAVRLAIARTPKIALRVMLAHVLCGGALWKVEPERQQVASEAIGAALSALPSQAAFAAEREAARQILGLSDGDMPLVARDHGTRTTDVLAKLIDLSDKDVLRILAVLMAETLACGTALIDTLGERLAVDVGKHWQPDDTFFALVRDREAVGGMLAEVIGAREADSYVTVTGTKKKEIIRMALTGTTRAKVEGWLPRYMRFPQGGYTERALEARERAAA